jgi:transcriptional regulator with XRE-family HTH domain/tetratricopeptide (TPR) repeat protein
MQAPGAWLRRQREAAALSQEELAQRTGLSVRAISSLERGRTQRPHPNSIRVLTRGLGLSESVAGELVACYRADRHAESGLRLVPAEDAGPGLGVLPAAQGEVADGRVGVPRQLPAAVAPFAGRAAELAILDDGLAKATRDGSTVASVVWAISGMAGVGKTTLALQWAHNAAGRFPDGQLYVNLRGYDPGGQPADAGETIREFLQALGVASERIPPTLGGQAALYRSVLAGRRMLIVADNARNAEQVRALLPGAPGCVVLVTSRSHLGGLAAAEGARTLNLDVLSEAEAAEMLSARLGSARMAAEPAAVAELIELCGRLPIALAIVAARADLTGWSLTTLAEQLADAEARIGLLGLNDPAADVRAVFSWSCRQLSRAAAWMFRMLALHPGPDISVSAAASLGGVPVLRAQTLLHELAEARMAAECSPARYAMHDLLRAYAAEQASPDGTDSECGVATSRMLDYYLGMALAAAHALDPARTAAVDPPRLNVVRVAAVGSGEALAWFNAEHKVLLAVIAQAGRAGSDQYVVQLASTLVPFFERRSLWQDLAICQQAALDSSERLADLAGQARAHLYRGRALTHLGQTDLARRHLAQSEKVARSLDDHSAQAQAHLAFSCLWLLEGDLAESISSSLRALRLAEAGTNLALQGHACNNLGYGYAIQGHAERALVYCQRALDLCRGACDPYLEACAADSLGYVYDCLGDQNMAALSYQQAAELFQRIGARYHSARSLNNLRDCQNAEVKRDAACAERQQAPDVLDELSPDPDVSQMCGKIVDLARASRNRHRAGVAGRANEQAAATNLGFPDSDGKEPYPRSALRTFG